MGATPAHPFHCYDFNFSFSLFAYCLVVLTSYRVSFTSIFLQQVIEGSFGMNVKSTSNHFPLKSQEFFFTKAQAYGSQPFSDCSSFLKSRIKNKTIDALRREISCNWKEKGTLPSEFKPDNFDWLHIRLSSLPIVGYVTFFTYTFLQLAICNYDS